MSRKQFTQADKDVISEMLSHWGRAMKDKAPRKKEENDTLLDIPAMHEMEETKVLIEALKAVGVESNSHLMDMGFVAAGMVLSFKSKI